MSILARTQGTGPWLRAVFTPSVELRARKELRSLERAADARAAVLWFASGHEDLILAFTGDRSAIPATFPDLRATVPTFADFVLDGERVPAAVHVVQLGHGLPLLRVGTIAPGPMDSRRLFDAVERCAETLEEVAVSAITRR